MLFAWRVVKHVKSNRDCLYTARIGLWELGGTRCLGLMRRGLRFGRRRMPGCRSRGVAVGSDAFFPFCGWLDRGGGSWGVLSGFSRVDLCGNEEVISRPRMSGIRR